MMDWLESEIIGNLKGVNVCIKKFEKELKNAESDYEKGLHAGLLNGLREEKRKYESLLRHFETYEQKEKRTA
jgi:hypothetical protein